MNTNEFEYYFIERENNDQYPLLTADTGCPPYLRKKEYIENPETMKFRLGKPVPRIPKMVDYHSAIYPVVSQKIYDVLAPMNIKGIQLIPAIITGKKMVIFNGIYENYWFINICNKYPALDREKSECHWDSMGVAYYMEKIVLNEEYLKTIPLEERLVFFLSENGVKQFFHKSVVDAIMATNPKGLRFYNVREWEEGQQFD